MSVLAIVLAAGVKRHVSPYSHQATVHSLPVWQINVTAEAALDSTADLGLAILPNPLVRIAAICAMAGFTTGPWSRE